MTKIRDGFSFTKNITEKLLDKESNEDRKSFMKLSHSFDKVRQYIPQNMIEELPHGQIINTKP
jgi:hypothetical protein